MTQTRTRNRLTLEDFRRMKCAREKFSMLTAYDFPTAAAAERAGVHSLLVGDSAANVVLGLATTREIRLDYLITIAAAVRRGAPRTYLIGDVPFESMQAGPDGLLRAAERFCGEAGCDAVKFEAETRDDRLVAALAGAGYTVIAHLGLRPQTVLTPDGYRAQARDAASIAQLVDDCRRMVDAGAPMLLLEAVPNEASQAVIDATDVPVIGCGAGPACDGHVVVTHDLLGFSATRPPKFVPVLADMNTYVEEALRRYVESIDAGAYPAPQHVYPLRTKAGD